MKKKVVSMALAATMLGGVMAQTSASAALEDYSIVTNAEE